MKILITGGGKGTFAEKIAVEARMRHRVVCLSRKQLDTACETMHWRLYDEKPDVIIHCGAFAKPINTHEQFPEKSVRNNILGTAKLVHKVLELKRKTKVVFISTDYVYPGLTGNYKETDPLKPINFYAQSKLAGEMAVSMLSEHLIFRASVHDFPYQHKNVFYDLWKSPLWKDEAVKIIMTLIDAGTEGIYNLGGPRMSAFDFIKQRHADVQPISTEDIPEGKFPVDCSMNLAKLETALGKSMEEFLCR